MMIIGSMAKKSKSSKTKKVKTPGKTRNYARTAASKGKSFLGGHKIRWGEVALSALVGYEGGNIIDPIIGDSMYSTLWDKGGLYRDFANQASGAGNGDLGKGINKDLGFVALAKVVYDVVKTHKLKDEDVNLYLPYVVGTVFDPPKGSSSSGGGDW